MQLTCMQSRLTYKLMRVLGCSQTPALDVVVLMLAN